MNTLQVLHALARDARAWLLRGIDMDIKSELKGARSRLARWVDAHLRLTSIGLMVAAFPLTVGVFTIVGWFL